MVDGQKNRTSSSLVNKLKDQAILPPLKGWKGTIFKAFSTTKKIHRRSTFQNTSRNSFAFTVR